MQEDGFINIRVAQQVLAGNGPVFNAGERVEAFTSPLWIALLVVLRTLTGGLVAYESLAVGAGIVLSVGGTAAMLAGAVWLWTPRRARPDRAWWVPVGILVPLAVAPFWDFSTSGLETSLSWAWLGASFATVCAALRTEPDRPPRWLLGRYVLIGLGPLVRPELAIYAVALGALLLLLVSRPTGSEEGRRWWWVRPVLAWAAIPFAYQLFRMGYYAAVVPNTALAKDAGSGTWDRGVTYLENFAGTYRLAIPAIVLVALLVLRPRPQRAQRQVLATLVGAALLHALYVVWVGGDYMHGRFWIVPTLALVAPLAALPYVPAQARSDRRQLAAPAAAALLAIWGLVAMGAHPPRIDGGGAIDDQRALVVGFTGNQHPVALDDQPAPFLETGAFLADLDGADTYVDVADLLEPAPQQLPRTPGLGTATRYDAIGVSGVRAGIDVDFIDPFGLADPVAARQPAVSTVRAGHGHHLPEPWRLARGSVVTDDPAVAAARRALACGALGQLMDGVTAPMSPGRFLRNVVEAPANTTLSVPLDPIEAEQELCGS